MALALLSFATHAAEKPVIQLYVTVDWEGWTLEEDNLQTMRDFRKKYPHIPMLHFLNPAYPLRPGTNAAEIKHKIQSTLLPNDTLGLHVHAWKSLTDTCGIPFKEAPNFSGPGADCHAGECGYTVSLELAFSQSELTQLISCSADLLQKQGFKRPTSFRAGGWQQGQKLANALLASGLTMDSSRTVAHLLTTRWPTNSNLVKFVSELHAGSTPLDQPYELLPGLMEYPNNASLADYTSAQKLLEIFNDLIRNNKRVMVLGFHQETAASYLHRLEDAIPLIEKEAVRAGVRLEWLTYP